MAKYQQAVDVVIRGRTENLKAAFGMANQSLTTLSSKLVRLRTMAISTFGAYTIARGLASLTGAALEFQKQMAEVHTMLRDGGERFLPAFTKQVRELSIEFGQSTDTIAKGLYDILSAGIPAEGAMDVLRASLISATGGLTDLQTAAYGATTLINAYRLEADQATHVNDLLFTVVEQGKIRFNELSIEIGKLAPVARAAGISMEEMMAMIAAVVRVEEPARAMTALRAAIMSVAGTGRNFIDLTRSLEDATLAQIQLEGITRRGAVGMSIMTGNIDNLNEQFRIMENVAGKSMGAANKVMQTMWFTGQQLKQLFEDFKRVMGEEVAKALIKMGMEFKKNREQLTELAKSIGKIIGQLIDLTVKYRYFLIALLGFGVAVKVFAVGFAVVKGLTTALAMLFVKKTADVAMTKAQVVATTHLTAAQLHLAKAISITTAARTAGNIQSARWASLAAGNIAATKGMATSTLNLTAIINPFTIALAAAAVAYLAYTKEINKANKAQERFLDISERINRVLGLFPKPKPPDEISPEHTQAIESAKEFLALMRETEKEIIKLKEEKINLWKSWSIGSGSAKRAELARQIESKKAEKELFHMLFRKQEVLDLEFQKKAKLKKLDEERIAAQRKAFLETPAGQWDKWLEDTEHLYKKLEDIKIQYMEDGEQKALAINARNYEKMMEAEKEKATVTENALIYIKGIGELDKTLALEKYRKIREDKQKKEQEKLIKEQWDMENNLQLSLAKAWIDLYKKDYEARLYYIALLVEEQKAAAKEIGLNLNAVIEETAEIYRRIAAQNFAGDGADGADGVWGKQFRESAMGIRAPGYADPMKLLHQDNMTAQKTRENAKISADGWAEKIYDRLGESEPVDIFEP